MSQQFLDIANNLELWDACIKIYRDSFPLWEREDEKIILQNIQSSAYKMFAYTIEKEIVGFYILDVNKTLDYTLFSFLAIKESKRGLGLGSKLCLNAIEYFHKEIQCNWLFIEAEKRQANLYAKLGFKTLDIDYRVPAFNSKESIDMSLMLIEEKDISKEALSPIIKDIFLRGYGLEADDERLKKQLQRI